MSDQTKIILIICALVLFVILLIILIHNARKSSLKKDIDESQIRFNTIKTIPLLFKIRKAQAIAKGNEETAQKVKIYCDKYEEAQKHIDEIANSFEAVEDEYAAKNYKVCKELLTDIINKLTESEKEVEEIDNFLEQFSEEETALRENSTKLKAKFLKLKQYANNNANNLTIAYNGIEKKIENVEELFSQSEEFIYINDYNNASKSLDLISESIIDIEKSMLSLPELVRDTKGVIPTLLDEVNRQYALARQRGVYSEHLKIKEEVEKIEEALKEDLVILSLGNLGDVKKHNEEYKLKLNNLLESINIENKDFNSLKEKSDDIATTINELKNLYNYVSKSYQNDKERFGIDDIDTYLADTLKSINEHQASYMSLNSEIVDNNMPASKLMLEANELEKELLIIKEGLTEYKAKFDKNTTDEQRAKSQLMKLQVVLNEVEVKVLEYHFPAIAASYKDDLIKGRQMIQHIKDLLNEIPLNIEELNNATKESMEFVYTFYNNVNNIVGMAIMVENAIVSSNKYRSSHPEVERDLSRAELCYLNGEYTKALTMAISCMERLFPKNKENDYLENA